MSELMHTEEEEVPTPENKNKWINDFIRDVNNPNLVPTQLLTRDRAKAARKAHEKKGKASTSTFRGVTHHIRTGRYESHIWEEGKQLYLGGFDTEEEAALCYDLASTKFRGAAANTNFDMCHFPEQLRLLTTVTTDELVGELRGHSRKDSGKLPSSSKYRGVTRHAKGKYEARIGQASGRKYKYLGLFVKEEDAAAAYDKEAVLQKGSAAQTNFAIDNYLDCLTPEDLAHVLSKQRPGEGSAADAAAAFTQASTVSNAPKQGPEGAAMSMPFGFQDAMSFLSGLEPNQQQTVWSQMMATFQAASGAGNTEAAPPQRKKRPTVSQNTASEDAADTKRTKRGGSNFTEVAKGDAGPRPRPRVPAPLTGTEPSNQQQQSSSANFMMPDPFQPCFPTDMFLQQTPSIQQQFSQPNTQMQMQMQMQQGTNPLAVASYQPSPVHPPQQQQLQSPFWPQHTHLQTARPPLACLPPIATSTTPQPTPSDAATNSHASPSKLGSGSLLGAFGGGLEQAGSLYSPILNSPGFWELLNSPTCLGDLGAADMTSFPPKDDALMQDIQQSKYNPFQAGNVLTGGITPSAQSHGAFSPSAQTSCTDAAAAALVFPGTAQPVKGSANVPPAAALMQPAIHSPVSRRPLQINPHASVRPAHNPGSPLKHRLSRATSASDLASPSFLQCLIDQFSTRGTME